MYKEALGLLENHMYHWNKFTMWSQNNISTFTKRKKPNGGAAFDSSMPMATDIRPYKSRLPGGR